MRKERSGQHKGFDFTEHEQLFERLSHERLLALLEQQDTRIHEVAPSSNTYGEFLFVSLSKVNDPFRGYVSFWGLGYHEERERWISDEWFWFRSTARTSLLETYLPRHEAKAIIEQRKQDIETWAMDAPPQSEHGKLFETLAELTDEDGAYTELQDMEAVAGSGLAEKTAKPVDSDEAAKLLKIKEGIVIGWRALPSEHQATLLLTLLKEVRDDYYRGWLVDAIDELYRQD